MSVRANAPDMTTAADFKINSDFVCGEPARIECPLCDWKRDCNYDATIGEELAHADAHLATHHANP